VDMYYSRSVAPDNTQVKQLPHSTLAMQAEMAKSRDKPAPQPPVAAAPASPAPAPPRPPAVAIDPAMIPAPTDFSATSPNKVLIGRAATLITAGKPRH